MLEDLAPWITPALLVGLFAWLRADIRRMEDRFRSEMGDLRAEMSGLRAEMRAGEDRLRSEMNGLRSEMNDMRSELRGQIEGLDGGLRAVEAGLAELRGQVSFIQDYILRRNAPPEEASAAPAE